jgi:glycosyltransferase involved in cell wall biosynthesis
LKNVAMIVMSQYPGDPRVRREAEALERRGISVDIVCFRNPGQSQIESFDGVTAYRVMAVRDKTSIVKYTLFSMSFGLIAFLKLLAMSFQRRYHLVQIHNMPDQLVFSAFFHRLFGIPVVLDLHDLMVELFESKWDERRSRIMLPLVKFIEKVSCGFANKLITTSTGFQDHLIERGIDPEKITLVLNSADNNIFYRPKKGPMARHARRGQVLTAPSIVYHGTIAHRFGIHVLIEAVALLRDRGLNPTLRLHGKYDEDYQPVLESMISHFNLGDSVHLGGYLLHEDIRDLLYDMDIGVVPYLSDSFMDLALSTKSFEYIAMELPVVASRVGSMTNLFSDSAMKYFTPDHVDDLADQIEFFCRTPEARDDFPAQADLEYAEIAWPVMESRYVDLIEELMS